MHGKRQKFNPYSSINTQTECIGHQAVSASQWWSISVFHIIFLVHTWLYPDGVALYGLLDLGNSA